MLFINVFCRKRIVSGYAVILLMIFYVTFWITRCLSLRDMDCIELQKVIKKSDFMIYDVKMGEGYHLICLPLDSIPVILQCLVIMSEDRRFYDHKGIDIFRAFTAVQTNYKAGKTVLGASTITQQLVKILWGSHKRTVLGKIHESFGALILDALLTKDRILELYFNSAVWIPGHIGIYNAVFHEYKKKVSALNQHEMIALSVSLPAPVLPEMLDTNRRYHNRYIRLKEEAVKTGLLESD